MDWKVLAPFIFGAAGFILSGIINLLKNKYIKLITDKKECPKCKSENVTYRGRSRMKRVKKEGKIFPVIHYTFECKNCHTHFEYYGEV